jgi:hypothetical protein
MRYQPRRSACVPRLGMILPMKENAYRMNERQLEKSREEKLRSQFQGRPKVRKATNAGKCKIQRCWLGEHERQSNESGDGRTRGVSE